MVDCQFQNEDTDQFFTDSASVINYFNNGLEIFDIDDIESNNDILLDQKSMLLIQIKTLIIVWKFPELSLYCSLKEHTVPPKAA